MKKNRHQDSFDNIYKKLPESDPEVCYPLRDIEQLDLGMAKEMAKEYFCYMYRRFSCHILNDINLSDGQNLLVVGCGQGFDEKNVNYLFPDVVIRSTDISSEMIKRAISGKSPSVFSISSAENIPFPDNSFDRVISREVIEHVDNPQNMLVEISRVLRVGGIAVVTTENEKSLSAAHVGGDFVRCLLGVFWEKGNNEPTYKDEAPSLVELKDYLSNTDLDLAEVYYDGVLYQTLPLLSRVISGRKLAKLAHRLSALECRPILSKLFCDQVKYILIKKPTGRILQNAEPDFVCPQCHGVLQKKDGFYCCEFHGEFPLEPMPDFVLSDEVFELNKSQGGQEETGISNNKHGLWHRIAGAVERRLIGLYSLSLIALGFALSALLTSPPVGSKRLRENSNLQKFVDPEFR